MEYNSITVCFMLFHVLSQHLFHSTDFMLNGLANNIANCNGMIVVIGKKVVFVSLQKHDFIENQLPVMNFFISRSSMLR